MPTTAEKRAIVANLLAQRGGSPTLIAALQAPPRADEISARMAARTPATPRRSAATPSRRRDTGGGGGGGSYGNAAHPGSPVLHKGPRHWDHKTMNLPGYPAYDYMAPAGSPAVAPVGGTVIRLSGHDPSGGPTNGPHGPFGYSVYIRGNDGKTYFLTHMGSRTVKPGQRVRQGQRIGTVGNYAKWGGANHIHQGVRG